MITFQEKVELVLSEMVQELCNQLPNPEKQNITIFSKIVEGFEIRIEVQPYHLNEVYEELEKDKS